jgi:lysozyme
MITLPGVDLASFQGEPGQWRGLAGHIAFAGVKLTELSASDRYVNPDALADLAALREMGAGRILYLFAHPSVPTTATVSLFMSVARPLLTAGDAVAVDLEVSDGMPPSRVAAWGCEVLARLHLEAGRMPLLYTFRSFAAAGNCAGMGGYPLWIADPDHPAGRPDVPAPWKTWAIHQYASSPIDRDVAAYPSLAAMRAALGKPAPKPSPDAAPEDTMLLNRGKNAVTPIVLAPGDKTLYLLGSTPGAEVIVHFGGQSPETAKELYFKNGAESFPVPAGCTGAEVTRVDGGTNDVGWRVA